MKIIICGLKLSSILLYVAVAFGGESAWADVQVGVQFGGLGGLQNVEGQNTEAVLAGGALIRFRPFTFGAIQLDGLFGKFSDQNFWSVTPGMGLFLADYSEFRFGATAGLGFYSATANQVRFGIHYGPTVEMAMTDQLSMGFMARLNHVFSDQVADHWSATLSFAWTFESGGW